MQQQERRAYVSIRQSTQTQVRHHRTSQDNQYALVERAQALGWPRERIYVIDEDLGQSGQDSTRKGFQELVSAVSALAGGAHPGLRSQSTGSQERRLVSPA